jgi:hypothetical protein
MNWKPFTVADPPTDYSSETPVEVFVEPSEVPVVYVVRGILPIIVNRTEYRPGQEITSTIPEAQLDFLLSGGHVKVKE